MISRFITEVSTVFNPFSPKAKTARLFLSFLPPNARQTMKITTKLLPRTSKDPSFVELKFSKSPLFFSTVLHEEGSNTALVEDGMQMKLDAEKLGVKGVIEEVDRHSRMLSRQEELTGN
ncbi:54S ribosomal protein L44, mitochondrial [Lachnellula cervina]|uniref:Large ribosomal subunit protein mL53 n=1 Tax=Lachnellula cervina TaxID=1316786 RepID=A0A7D8UVC1_9HELO|nr:54S ribosomal protein L44, mitochondrial [Lachnellula cervina]